jgi:tRNA/rRNA methyltransferase
MSEETNSWEKILQPCIILVRPQLGENIGMCARAMLNCGLTEMRIVAPRDGWPNPAAVSASAGAGSVLENAGVYASLEEASADLHHLIATTNRLRDMVKPIYSPEGAMGFTRDSVTKGERVGIVFGPERTGLENTDIAQCGSVLTIPLNPGFSSLNLAQAVLVVSYEWARLARFGDVEARIERTGESDWAT